MQRDAVAPVWYDRSSEGQVLQKNRLSNIFHMLVSSGSINVSLFSDVVYEGGKALLAVSVPL